MNNESGIGMSGGCSWTKKWLQFDNSYYHSPHIDTMNGQQEDCQYLLWLPTDQAIFESPEFKPYFQKYAQDELLFFKEYKLAHKKMSELGAKFYPSEGIHL